METWLYLAKEYTRGPVGADELSRLFAEGTVTPSTPVWQEGMDSWVRLDEVDELGVITKALPSRAQVDRACNPGVTSARK